MSSTSRPELSAGAGPVGRSRRRSSALVVATLAALLLHLWGLYRPADGAEPPLFLGIDKLQHAVGFALPVVFGLLCVRRFVPQVLRLAGVLTVLGLFVAHAVVSELLQSRLIAGRMGDPLDTAADLLGVAIGGLAAVAVRRRP